MAPVKQPTENQSPAAWWQRPFDGYTLTLAALFCGAMLWNALFPGFYYMLFAFFVITLWGGIAAVVGVRLLIAGIGNLVTGRPVVWAGWGGVMVLITVVSAVILLKLPLHAGFALAQADLDRAVQEDLKPGDSFSLARSQYGIYGIRQTAHRRCHHKDRIYFALANDSEAAFVYSPSGIDDLCYNSGSKGHLAGNWYWMAED